MTEPEAPESTAPAPDEFGCAITSITVGNGLPLPLSGAGTVVAVVGANNVGKSTLLREIKELVSQAQGERRPTLKVLRGMEFEWIGSIAAMETWVRSYDKYDPSEARYAFADPLTKLKTARNGTGVPGSQWQWFVNQQAPSEREKVCDPTPRLDFVGDRPKHPFHTLSTNEEARSTVQTLAQKLFQQHLELDNLSGKIGFAVGDPQIPAPPVNAVSTEYAAALGSLPRLHEQGDGMRSALGLLIPLVTDHYCISLIDEPEAFLHPPQARTLGTEVANLARANKSQVILATHDKNFLQGLVESGAPVTVVHLTREGDNTRAQLLDSQQVQQLWEDPVLRYGNALDGLFHSAVIVTEGDRDSQFYAAAIDHKLSQYDPPRVHNLMFLAAHGKTNLPTIVERLTTLGIKTVSTPDLDILNDEAVLKRLVGAHGGDWSAVESNYKKATNQFTQPTQYPTLTDVANRIDTIIKGTGEIRLTKELAAQIREVVSVKSPWAMLKTAGDRAFTGDKAAAKMLLDDLDDLGIACVRVGELEGFLITANVSKGSGFLKVAFDENAQKSEETQKHATTLLKATGQL